jgi:serine/threonine protein kinase
MNAACFGPNTGCMSRTAVGRSTVEKVIDDRYLIRRRIGVGATAVVYLAEDLALPRTVAIKLLHDWLAEDHEEVERFGREASTASGLHHPHIVGVYASGGWTDGPYIVMEYVAGRSLKTLIRDAAPLPPARAIDLAVQLLRAVRYIHARGIIHHDLKPDNAIVGTDGQLKLTDFGIARRHDADITPTGVVIGTVQYLSPEQIEGEPARVASDLYSVGVTLYELLTGQVPFNDDTIAAVLRAHVQERPAPPSALNPAVSSQLDSIVIRALDKNPQGRFSNADTFISALEHAVDSRVTDRSGPAQLAEALAFGLDSPAITAAAKTSPMIRPIFGTESAAYPEQSTEMPPTPEPSLARSSTATGQPRSGEPELVRVPRPSRQSPGSLRTCTASGRRRLARQRP